MRAFYWSQINSFYNKSLSMLSENLDGNYEVKNMKFPIWALFIIYEKNCLKNYVPNPEFRVNLEDFHLCCLNSLSVPEDLLISL
jgi:hypothetical protein